MAIRKAALRPEYEAPRKTWQGPRGTTNYVSLSNAADSATNLRLQRLFVVGIVGNRADLIASLAWGATS